MELFFKDKNGEKRKLLLFDGYREMIKASPVKNLCRRCWNLYSQKIEASHQCQSSKMWFCDRHWAEHCELFSYNSTNHSH